MALLWDAVTAAGNFLADTTTKQKMRNIAPPEGDYGEWREIIRSAVANNAPPSPDLIEANQRLAQWESHLGIGEVSSFPVSVYLSLTDVCNARCSFCSYSPETSAKRQIRLEDIEKADWLKFSRLFSPNGQLSEPLAHPQIAEVLAAVRRHAPFVNMAVTTNASLLNERVCRIIAGHMRLLYVSLNAARKETYESTMAPLKWQKVIDNLSRLRDEKAKAGTERPDVIASVVAHRHNLDELPELPELLDRLGITKLRIQIMNVQGPVPDRTLFSDDDTPQARPEQANAAFRALERECEAYRVTLTYPLPAYAVQQKERRTPGASIPSPANQPRTNGSAKTPKFQTVAAMLTEAERNEGDNDLQTRPVRRPTVSREWVKAEAAGEPIFCERPWDTLKVNLSDQTKICCTFFTKLPTFEWPSAKDFHKPDGMWNHPFMQHMRSGMGKLEEVPYCTLCQTKDKRDPQNRNELATATKDSLKIYRQLMPTPHYWKTIDRINEPLPMWSMETASDGPAHRVEPFRWEKDRYRDAIAQAGFAERGHVLHLGVAPFTPGNTGLGNYTISPFLAEANTKLYLANENLEQIQFAKQLCFALGLRNISCIDVDGRGRFPFKDASLDGIWMSGNWLCRYPRAHALRELRRILKPDGRLHIRQGAGLGRLVQRIINGDPQASSIIEQISKGPLADGINSHFSRRSLETVLRSAGLTLDTFMLPKIQYYSGKGKSDLFNKGGTEKLAAFLKDPQFLANLQHDRSILTGIAKSISFNAKPLGAF